MEFFLKRPGFFFPFGEGVGFLGLFLFRSSSHDYPIKFPMGSQLFPKFPMFLNVFSFASHLSHMLCTKSSSFRWATMGTDMIFMFDMNTSKLGNLKENPSFSYESGHKSPSLPTPCDLRMFRFMITFILSFLLGKAHLWQTSPK
jgi:hypothetical protein